MVSMLNFKDILHAGMERYRPFDLDVSIDRKPLSLIEFIRSAQEDGRNPVIAEIKPASPTSGWLKDVPDPGRMAADFVACGACGVSVLTEPIYFNGSLENLRSASDGLEVPVLRKDFLFHPAQIKESYHYGADSVLLISSFFEEDGLAGMIGESRNYGMEPLVEIHDREDAERSMSAGAKLIAINNRDKDTLAVDLNRTERLSGLVDGTLVSASGIESCEQLKKMLGYCDAALIGSALMRSGDPCKSLRSLVYGGAC